MVQSIGHVGLFASKLLGAIFGALMLTFILGEFPGSFSTLSGMELLLLFLGVTMAIGFLFALYRPIIGGILAVASIFGINAIALIQESSQFEFDFLLQFVLGLTLIGFSWLSKQEKSQEGTNGNHTENSHSQ